MRQLRTFGSVGAPGGKPPGATRSFVFPRERPLTLALTSILRTLVLCQKSR
jgi:hypothetical protein